MPTNSPDGESLARGPFTGPLALRIYPLVKSAIERLGMALFVKIADGVKRQEYQRRMRENPTPSETRFARRLAAAGFKYEMQKSLGLYFADFFLRDRLVVIEIDGGYHDTPEQQRKDEYRDAFLKQCRLPVIRIKNEEVDSWPLEKLNRYSIKTHRSYCSVMGSIGKRKQKLAREKGWKVTKAEKREARRRFNVPLGERITPEHIMALRNGVNP